MAKMDEMNHRKGGKMKKDWTWYWYILQLLHVHVRAILGKKAAQLPTRAGGAKNTKLTWFGGFSRSSNSQYQAYSRLGLNYRKGPFESWIFLISF